ncbi:MAG: hypothetical protein PHQ66_02055 [Candidatus Nanoarchaeia archaeon]|nr:hypothetical protein [Candidatus Nanoarchaeia archaeon]MDD5357844.1 hypothetical protein [Candidatus Nanoarchaeia archaeon]MDD5588763.1 hypothetical protein [Candidatus Nanoarchaeia archaeon]
MKKLVTFAVITLFLISLISAGAMTSKTIEKLNDNDTNQIQAADDETTVQNKIRERAGGNLTDEQIRKIFKYRNRIKAAAASAAECPNNCTCTGSATKCILEDGTREMTITAGKSGNIIIQVKGINASTSVTLYKSDGKIYAVNKNNETVRVRLLPDQIKEKIRERLQKQLENESITFGEDNIYRYRGEKGAKLFSVFPVKVSVEAELNPETGRLVQIKNSWWAFLAKDDESEGIVGASCGTVTPGENDNCCISKGFEKWNSETSECEFIQNN